MVDVGLEIESRLIGVRERVAEAALRADRDPASITVVGVSKTVGRDVVDAAYAAGLRNFGENRVQDATAKFADPLPVGAVLHMIGQLQTNKVSVAARLFDVFQSVDRTSLVAELEKQGAKQGRVLPVLLQVNVAREERKAGCAPEAAPALVAHIRACAHLELRGLMTIAPLAESAEDVRPVFRGLRALRDQLADADRSLSLPVLSMGMSNDFDVAIEEGATHVRIGRAIFSG